MATHKADPLAHLRQLAELAHDTDAERRHDLLRGVTDVFMANPSAYSSGQKGQFGAIMEQLAYDLERHVREELARRIAAELHAPRDLILRLAEDEIPVARPVLEQSPVLTQDDLVRIAFSKGRSHLLAISRRMDIGARLAAVLVDLGDDGVVASLLRNASAKLDAASFSCVGDRAKDSTGLQKALIERDDVPKDVLLGLLDHVSCKIRRSVQSKLTDADNRKLDRVIGSLRTKIKNKGKSQVELRIERLAKSGGLNEAVVLRLVLQNRPIEFFHALSKLTRLDVTTTHRALTDETGQMLAIACRAADFSVEAFKAIIMSPMTAVASDLHQALSLVQLYQRLTRRNAQRVMELSQTQAAGARAA